MLYDRSNNAWVACVWWMLRVCGADSAVLNGGWQKWAAEKRPVSSQPAGSAITYFGGGVAESLDALALTLIGLPKVTVYHGSMTEWAADPKLPMETGRPTTP